MVELRDLGGSHTGVSAYALREKIIRILPRCRVAISFRDLDPHGGFNHIAAFKIWKDALQVSCAGYAIAGSFVCDHIQPHTSRYGNHPRDIRSHLFDGIDLDINRERAR